MDRGCNDPDYNPFNAEEGTKLTKEVVALAESITTPLLAKAHAAATREETLKGISKTILALGVGIAVVGHAYYSNLGPKRFGELVSQLVTEAMETLKHLKEGNDDAEAEGSSWDQHR